MKIQISPQIYRPVSQNNLTCEDAEKRGNKRNEGKKVSVAPFSLSANQRGGEAEKKARSSGAIIRKERAST